MFAAHLSESAGAPVQRGTLAGNHSLRRLSAHLCDQQGKFAASEVSPSASASVQFPQYNTEQETPSGYFWTVWNYTMRHKLVCGGNIEVGKCFLKMQNTQDTQITHKHTYLNTQINYTYIIITIPTHDMSSTDSFLVSVVTLASVSGPLEGWWGVRAVSETCSPAGHASGRDYKPCVVCVCWLCLVV